MTSLPLNEPNVFASNLFSQSGAILRAMFATMIGLLGLSTIADADVITDRRAGFRTNVTSMKNIAAAIGEGDYQTIINQAETIASWAEKIPTYFPEASKRGDTNAGPNIWANFDNFTALAKANENAANKLVRAAKSGDPEAIMVGLENLGSSCKTCHKLYKN